MHGIKVPHRALGLALAVSLAWSPRISANADEHSDPLPRKAMLGAVAGAGHSRSSDPAEAGR